MYIYIYIYIYFFLYPITHSNNIHIHLSLTDNHAQQTQSGVGIMESDTCMHHHRGIRSEKNKPKKHNDHVQCIRRSSRYTLAILCCIRKQHCNFNLFHTPNIKVFIVLQASRICNCAEEQQQVDELHVHEGCGTGSVLGTRYHSLLPGLLKAMPCGQAGGNRDPQ